MSPYQCLASFIFSVLSMMTVVVPFLSAFLMLIAVLFPSSLRAVVSLRDRLLLAFNIGISASCVLTFSRALMVEPEASILIQRETDVVFVFSAKNVLETHSPREVFQISREVLSDFGFTSHGSWY